MNKREQAAEITLGQVKGEENHCEVRKHFHTSSRCLWANLVCIFHQKGWKMVRGFKGNRRAASEAGITHCCPCTKPQSFPAGKVTAKQVPALFKYPRVETDLEMIPLFIPHNLFLLVLVLGVKHPSIPWITAKDFPPSTNPFSVDLE